MLYYNPKANQAHNYSWNYKYRKLCYSRYVRTLVKMFQGKHGPTMNSKAKIKDSEWQNRPPRPWLAGGTPLKRDEMSEADVIFRQGEFVSGEKQWIPAWIWNFATGTLSLVLTIKRYNLDKFELRNISGGDSFSWFISRPRSTIRCKHNVRWMDLGWKMTQVAW